MLGEQGAGINNTIDLHANLHRLIVASIAIWEGEREGERKVNWFQWL